MHGLKNLINYDKTWFTQFQNKNSKSLDIQVHYSNRICRETVKREE
jgi:hypothetical protein